MFILSEIAYEFHIYSGRPQAKSELYFRTEQEVMGNTQLENCLWTKLCILNFKCFKFRVLLHYEHFTNHFSFDFFKSILISHIYWKLRHFQLKFKNSTSLRMF
jgi:hypothetical protein